jgi:hypothetical protein
MGFNRREMESRRKAAAEKEAAARRALDPQSLEDAERLVAAWNERQAGRMPLRHCRTGRDLHDYERVILRWPP